MTLVALSHLSPRHWRRACARLLLWAVSGAILACCPSPAARAAADGATTQPAIVAPSEEDRALAQRVLAAEQTAMNTPAQEGANMAIRGWPGGLLKMLTGETPATAEQLQSARNILTPLAQTMEAGPAWPRPAKVNLPLASSPPAIDGDLSDPVWKGALTFRGLYEFGHQEALDQPATTIMALWDQDNLYFAFDCDDRQITVPGAQRDGDVYTGDCVELFLLPEMRFGMYWELIVGGDGAIFDALHCKQVNQWGAITRLADSIHGLRTAVTLKPGKDTPAGATPTLENAGGYRVEIAMPFAQLPSYSRGNRPVAGQTLYWMLCRLDANGKEFRAYSFVPLLNWGHNIWNHQEVVLAK